MKQDQFLDVIDRDEAERRFRAALDAAPLGAEEVRSPRRSGACWREDVARAGRCARLRSLQRRWLRRARRGHLRRAPRIAPRRAARSTRESIATGVAPEREVRRRARRRAIATGGVVPRGADAVVMVEHTDLERAAPWSWSAAPAAPGGERHLRRHRHRPRRDGAPRGTRLTSRETGVLAALGLRRVAVVRAAARRDPLHGRRDRRARRAACGRACVYDSNATHPRRRRARARRRAGRRSASCRDDEAALREALAARARACGRGPALGRHLQGRGRPVVSRRGGARPPGIVVHGVALKPGKPLCLAASRGRKPGGDPAGLPDVRDLHVPRVRGAGDPAPGGPAPPSSRARSRRACRCASTPSAAARSTCSSVSCRRRRRRRSSPTRWARAAGR